MMIYMSQILPIDALGDFVSTIRKRQVSITVSTVVWINGKVNQFPWRFITLTESTQTTAWIISFYYARIVMH